MAHYVGNNPVNFVDPTGHNALPSDLFLKYIHLPPYDPGNHITVPLWVHAVDLMSRGVRIGLLTFILNLLFASSVGNPETDPQTDADKAWALLIASEGPNKGHAIANHAPGLPDSTLINRITNDGKKASSKYLDYTSGGEAIWNSLKGASADIDAWMKDASNTSDFTMTYDAGKNIGYGFVRDASGNAVQNTAEMRYAVTVLRKDGNGGWFILTSYPTHSPPQTQ